MMKNGVLSLPKAASFMLCGSAVTNRVTVNRIDQALHAIEEAK